MNYTKNVIDSVKSYRTDVGFITMEIDDPDLMCTKLQDHDLVIIYSPENKKNGKGFKFKGYSKSRVNIGGA